MTRKLTDKQRRFCQLLVKGETQFQAYKKAGYSAKGGRKVCETNATRLMGKEGVKAYLAELRQKLEDEALMSATDKRRYLSQIVKTPIGEVDVDSNLCQEVQTSEHGVKYKMPCKLRAIEIDNKMAGHNQPEEIDVNLGGGVMIIPGDEESLDEWEAKTTEQQEALHQDNERDKQA